MFWITLATCLVVSGACGTSGGSQESRSAKEVSSAEPQDVETLTGALTRVVWVQDIADGTDIGSQGAELMLMGYDSHDGQGERPLHSSPGNFTRPLITPRGNRVVFSERRAAERVRRELGWFWL